MPRGDRGGTSTGIGKRCVAANCGNTNANGVSMHCFPKEQSYRRQWIEFVKEKRAKWDGPSEYSYLCSAHFEPHCITYRHRFEMKETGIRPKRITLEQDAIPTIHASPPSSGPSSTQTGQPSEPSAEPQASCSTSDPRLEMLGLDEKATHQCSPPKIIRRAFRKREADRVRIILIMYVLYSFMYVLYSFTYYIHLCIN